MRLEWLEDILAVADAGSLSVAAERRRLTQSAFSRRMQFIEQALGVQLFDRTRKPVQLRPAVRDRLDQIARTAAAMRQLHNDLQLGDRRSGNRVVLASQHALTAALTPQIIQEIDARHQDIHVRLRSANLDECFLLLLSRQADIALVYRPPNEEHPVEADYLETIRVASDRLIPVASREIADLMAGAMPQDLPVIAFPPEVFLGQVVTRLIYAHPQPLPRLVPKVETALTPAALELAVQGVGVAWIPATLAQRHLQNAWLFDLSGHLPDGPLDVTAMRLARGSSPAEIACWEVLTSRFAGHEPAVAPSCPLEVAPSGFAFGSG